MEHFGEDSSKTTVSQDYGTQVRIAARKLADEVDGVLGKLVADLETQRGLARATQRFRLADLRADASDGKVYAEITAREVLKGLRAALADVAERLDRVCPPWDDVILEKDLPVLRGAIADLVRLSGGEPRGVMTQGGPTVHRGAETHEIGGEA